ncbi:histidine kinase [Novosphingobium sp. EMRT-2]|uniref:histidine kinase n=1 Tax=Novosphingobium sp. EMRT-2 TaxID=2571749 RepID=UPI0010BDDCBA|nr:histidine kinase [Novosphingobium sp. EMRT-2]QCI93268.1 histidine kinase [Novosphingobium sp. EMRT-2]
MYRLISERMAWWPVLFDGVTEEGEVVTNKIELRFRILGEDDYVAWAQELAAPSVAEDGSEKAVSTDAAVARLMRVVSDWRGVGAENGEPLPFNAANFGALLQAPNVAPAVGRAYLACRRAAPEIREGN